jgi:hypothetical protein
VVARCWSSKWSSRASSVSSQVTPFGLCVVRQWHRSAGWSSMWIFLQVRSAVVLCYSFELALEHGPRLSPVEFWFPGGSLSVYQWTSLWPVSPPLFHQSS